MWSLRGFIPDSAFVQCDLDLQSLKAKRPYYTDKLAATTRIRVQSECLSTSLLYLSSSPAKVSSYLPFDEIANRNPWYDKMCTCANSDVSSFSSLVFKFLLYRPSLSEL